MRRLFKAAPAALAVLAVVGSIAPASARRLATGIDADDRYLFPNDPAVKSGVRVSRELLAAYGYQNRDFHCVFLMPDGTAGRVTILSLIYAAHGIFPVSVFKGRLTARDVAFAPTDHAAAARTLAAYALKAAGGDPARATAIIKEAERHDATCIRQQAQFYRTSIGLFQTGAQLVLDADGKWFVGRRPGSPPFNHLIASATDALNQLSVWVAASNSGYAFAYQQPETRRAKAPPPPPTAPKEAGKPPAAPLTPVVPKPVEIVDAQSELRLVLAKARETCLLRAIPNCQ